MKSKNDLPVGFLRENFSVNPETGSVLWSAPGRKRRVGAIAGTISPKGYLQIFLRLEGVNYRLYAHRVAWALHYGEWPVGEIDHKNGVKDDNSITNLRRATGSENKYNKPKQANNECGLKWVKKDNRPRVNPWRACVRKDKVEYAKSGFSSKEEAYEWASMTAVKLHGQFYNSGLDKP